MVVEQQLQLQLVDELLSVRVDLLVRDQVIVVHMLLLQVDFVALLYLEYLLLFVYFIDLSEEYSELSWTKAGSYIVHDILQSLLLLTKIFLLPPQRLH